MNFTVRYIGLAVCRMRSTATATAATTMQGRLPTPVAAGVGVQEIGESEEGGWGGEGVRCIADRLNTVTLLDVGCDINVSGVVYSTVK